IVRREDDEQQYGTALAKFPGQSFRPGDRVAFDANEQTREIQTVVILDRKADGRGLSDPCTTGLEELLQESKRSAMAELARHFCDEQRLEWYWLTPERPAQYADRASTLSPLVVEAIKAESNDFDTFYTHQAR